jgi:carotenoid cleavage dioxygenase-like enzyme
MRAKPADHYRRRLLAAGAGAAALGLSPVVGRARSQVTALPADPGAQVPWTSQNPFLTGAFAPVFDERDDADLKIDGALPRGLRGAFMRNGPNPQFAPDSHYAYPFDGTGMIHAIYVEDGKARYRNRWVATEENLAERRAGHRLYNSGFGPPPHANLANTNIVRHAGRYLALYEAGVPYEMDRDLETRGPFNYGGKLPRFMSAHPKLDPVTGELLSIAYNLRAGTLTYLRADKRGGLDRVVPLQAPWPAMVHDIAITDRYVLAFICPLVFDFSAQGPPARWQPDRGSVALVIPREAQTASEATWISGAPFFNFHIVNAFDSGDRIEVAFPWYDSYSLVPAGPVRLQLHKAVIDVRLKTLTVSALDDRVCEFGRVNEAYLGRRAKYGYVGLRNPRPDEKPQMGAFEAFARYDLDTGAKVVHIFPPGVTVCEPTFVADPSGKEESDGFIFTFAHDASTSAGLFMILDARDLSAPPMATVHLPRRVPAGLHGSWFAA